MQLAFVHVERHDATARPALHDQVDGEVLDEESRGMADRLLVQRVQHRMPGAVGRGAGAVRSAFAEMRRHAPEGTLVDEALLRARKRQAVVLQLDDRGRGLLAHELDGILIAQPVRSLDGVVHVPAPVVLAHVAQRSADASLRGDRMAACRKQLGDAGRRQARLGQAERRAQSGSAGADDDDVIRVVDEFVGAHGAPPNAIFRTANTPAAPMTQWPKVTITSATVLLPAECT